MWPIWTSDCKYGSGVIFGVSLPFLNPYHIHLVLKCQAKSSYTPLTCWISILHGLTFSLWSFFFFFYTVRPQNPQVSHPGIQPTADQNPQRAQLCYAILHEDLSFHRFWYPRGVPEPISPVYGGITIPPINPQLISWPSWHSTIKTQYCSSLSCSLFHLFTVCLITHRGIYIHSCMHSFI